MADKKILVVFGATGQQGGSVIESILNSEQASSMYKIRGITRDPSKPKAKELEKRGVEWAKADMEDKEALKKALQGAYAVYLVTDYWQLLDGEREFQQGKNVADAAKEAGVQHMVFSSLNNMSKLSNGKLKGIHHFDYKNKVEEYINEISLPATFFLAGIYATNWPGAAFRKQESGAYGFSLPIDGRKGQLPNFVPSDTGKWVKAILLDRKKYLGQRIYGAHKYDTPESMVEDFKAVFPNAGKAGGGAKYVQISGDQFKQGLKAGGMPDAALEEYLENMYALEDPGYYAKEDLSSHAACLVEGDKPVSWKEYIKTAEAFKGLD